MNAPTLIPTKYKERLPKTEAYPVGAQLVSESLADLPALDELSILFRCGKKERLERKGNILVFSVGYTIWHLGLSAANDMLERRWYGPKWDIHVYSVPRDMNHKARLALNSHGFARAHEWLCAPRPETWFDRSHKLELVFCPESSTIVPHGSQA